MGEGLAQVITYGSIALTVVALAIAVRTARSQRRIRPAFDVMRAVVGVTAIVMMAAITGVTTPVFLVGLAIVAGSALGLAQGMNLSVVPGEGGLSARRSPVGLVLWGAGIVVMQAAGIGARTGTVRFGQALAWFSVCIGIGLMVGRRGPMAEAREALSRVAVAAVLVAVAVPAWMLMVGPVVPAVGEAVLFDVATPDGGDLPFPWTYEGTFRREHTYTATFGARGSHTAVNEDHFVLTLFADGTVEGTLTKGGEGSVFECEDPAKAGQIYAHTVEPEVRPISSTDNGLWTHSGGVLTLPALPNGSTAGTYDADTLQLVWSYSQNLGIEGCFDGTFTLQETWVDVVIPRVSPPAGEKADSSPAESTEPDGSVATPGADDLPFPWTYEGTFRSEFTATANFGARETYTAVNEDHIVVTLFPDGTAEATRTMGADGWVVYCAHDIPAGPFGAVRSYTYEEERVTNWDMTHGGGVAENSYSGETAGTYDADAIDLSKTTPFTTDPDPDCEGGTLTYLTEWVDAIIPRVSPPAGEMAVAPPPEPSEPTEGDGTALEPSEPDEPDGEPLDPKEGEGAPPPPEPGGSEEEIEPEEAAGQAAAGAAAAVAIAAVTLVEAAGMAAGGGGSGGGGSPLGPDDDGPITSLGPVRTTTVYVTGDDAEAVLAGGVGFDVPIPEEQQSGVHASVEGEEAVTDDRYGTTGRVRSIGPVVRGPDGQVSVAVEVDAFTPMPDIEPITGPEPDLPEVVSRVPPPAPPGEGEVFTPEQMDRGIDRGMDDLANLPDLGSDQPPETSLPPAPPREGEVFTPEQVDRGVNRGMEDFEGVELGAGTRPGDSAGEDAVWVDLDGDGRVDGIGMIGPDGTMIIAADTDGDRVADTIYVDADGEDVPETAAGPGEGDAEVPVDSAVEGEEVRVWDPEREEAVWMTQEEADDFYAGLRDREIAAHGVASARDRAEWLDDWNQGAEAEQEAERIAREQAAAAWERHERLGDALITADRTDLLDRLTRDESIFDENGDIDIARQQQIADMLRDHLWREQAAPDPEYSETGQLIVDVGNAVDEFTRSIPVRIGTGMATGGISEIYHQGRSVVEAVKQSAERSVEWTFDPATGSWKPPQEDFGVLDGVRVAMDATARENIPGYNTAVTVMDPNATAGDVAGAVLWDAIGARMARGELNEAMDQVRTLGRGGRLPTGVRVHAPDPNLPTIRADAGDVIAPGPYSKDFLPQYRVGDDLSRLARGEVVPNDLVHQTGWTQRQIDHMNRIARENDAIIDARPSNVDSMRMIRDGDALAKPGDIKPKTLTIDDYYAGGCELDDIGKAGYYDPSAVRPRPLPADAPADMAARVRERQALRAKEVIEDGPTLRNMGGVEVRNGVVYDTATGSPYAGDIDAVAFRDRATGQPLTGERLAQTEAMWRNERYVAPDGTVTQPDADWGAAGAGQHGSEVTSAGDVIDNMVGTRTAGLDPTNPDHLVQIRQAQHEAYESARNMQSGLLDNSLGTGRETTLSVDGTGAPRVTDPSYAGPMTMAGINFPKHGA